MRNIYRTFLLISVFLLSISCEQLVDNSQKNILEGYGSIEGQIVFNHNFNSIAVYGPVYLVLIDNTSPETAPPPMGFGGVPGLAVISPEELFVDEKGNKKQAMPGDSPFIADFIIGKIPIYSQPHKYELRAYVDNQANPDNVDFHPLLTFPNMASPFNTVPYLNSMTLGDVVGGYINYDTLSLGSIYLPSKDSKGKEPYEGQGNKFSGIKDIVVEIKGDYMLQTDRPFFKLDQMPGIDVKNTAFNTDGIATLIISAINIKGLPQNIQGDTYDGKGIFTTEIDISDNDRNGINDGQYPLILLKKLKTVNGNPVRAATGEYVLDPANITLGGAVLVGGDVKDDNGNIIQPGVPNASNSSFVAAVSLVRYKMFPSPVMTEELPEPGKYAVYVVNSNGTMWSIPNPLGDHLSWKSLGQDEFFEILRK